MASRIQIPYRFQFCDPKVDFSLTSSSELHSSDSSSEPFSPSTYSLSDSSYSSQSPITLNSETNISSEEGFLLPVSEYMSSYNKPLFLIPPSKSGVTEPTIFLLDKNGKETYASYRGTYCKGSINNPSSYYTNENTEYDAQICHAAAEDYAVSPGKVTTENSPIGKSSSNLDFSYGNNTSIVHNVLENSGNPLNSQQDRVNKNNLQTNNNQILQPSFNSDKNDKLIPSTQTINPSLNDQINNTSKNNQSLVGKFNVLSNTIRPYMAQVDESSPINEVALNKEDKPGELIENGLSKSATVVTMVVGAIATLSISILLFRYIRKRRNAINYNTKEVNNGRSLYGFSDTYPSHLSPRGNSDKSSNISDISPASNRESSVASGDHSIAEKNTPHSVFRKAVCADNEIITKNVKYRAGPLDSVYISSGPSIDINSLYNSPIPQLKRSIIIPELYSSEGSHSLKVNKSPVINKPNPSKKVENNLLDGPDTENDDNADAILSHLTSLAKQGGNTLDDSNLPFASETHNYLTNPIYPNSNYYTTTLSSSGPQTHPAQPSIYGLFGKNDVFQREYDTWTLNNYPNIPLYRKTNCEKNKDPNNSVSIGRRRKRRAGSRSSNENLPNPQSQERVVSKLPKNTHKIESDSKKERSKKNNSDYERGEKVLEEISKNRDQNSEKKISLIDTPRFSANSPTLSSSPTYKSSTDSSYPYRRKTSSTISNLLSSPFTQTTASSPKCSLLQRSYTYPRLIHDTPFCKSLLGLPHPRFSGPSSSDTFGDDMEESVTRLYELIKCYYPADEVENFKKSDVHAILDMLLTNKISLSSALGQLSSKRNPKTKKKESYATHQCEDFKELVCEFEKIFSSALRNKQLHNESLQKEEELEDKLLVTQLMYDNIMKKSSSDQDNP